ncbi:MAG: DNA recombination protein RmuC [Spirochaetales bacterium]
MENIILAAIGLIAGLVIGYLIATLLGQGRTKNEREAESGRRLALEKELSALQAASESKIRSLSEGQEEKLREIGTLNARATEQAKLSEDQLKALSDVQANLRFLQESLSDKLRQIDDLKLAAKNGAEQVDDLRQKLVVAEGKHQTVQETLRLLQENLNDRLREIDSLKLATTTGAELVDDLRQKLVAADGKNQNLEENLALQKQQMEDLGKKFNLEFENIANKILETKSEKFTEVNKLNLAAILEPLGKNIDEFKKTVGDVYDKESKERFSLAEKVKELAQLNQTIGDEARNLTKALKGESKTQGRWGEMILETLLEKSGLRKGEEYFLEHQLTDSQGNPLRSDSESKRMRPDAVIKYPDQRTIIVDSKVSLNAFVRATEADDPDIRQQELNDHLQAVRNHIVALSSRGYDDYTQSLDFVMMFIPSEAAYMAAIQGDADLWTYAYDKRILLINPTNLIISLKLVSDLWKREHQNRNAQEIAERGAKLYDKFVTFAESLQDIGKNIGKSQAAYDKSFKLLAEGNDNLVRQAEKLRGLGLKTKKVLNLTSDAALLVDRSGEGED